MNCATCGRENPPHLTFCQECGQRLGPRIAPPTPPIGLGGDTAAGLDPFGTARPVPAAAPSAPAATRGPVRCTVCDTENAGGLRYCASCGSPLANAPASGTAPAPPYGAPPAPAPAPIPAAPYGAVPPAPYGAPPAPAAGARAGGQTSAASALGAEHAPAAAAIAPMRVVDLNAGREPSAAASPRTCPRCRGVVDLHAQFCKFCGSPLGDVQGASKPVTGPTPIKAPPVEPAPAPVPAPRPIEPPVAPARVVQAVPQPSPSAPNIAPGPARGATRSPTVRGRLVVIAKSGADGASYPIGDTLDIGRIEGNVVVTEDPYLSPRHVRILWNAGKFVLRDLASTNGVYLRLAPSRDMNAARRGPIVRPSGVAGEAESSEVAVPLEDQDLILVGQQVFRFEIERSGGGTEAGFGPATASSTSGQGSTASEHGTLVFGSPAGARYARLCQRSVEGITRDVYYVRKVETVFGRESGDVVFTEDPFLSRRHAAVRVSGDDPKSRRFALVDLGSSNGTFLRIRGDVELVPGDQFRVGQQLFRVDFEPGGKTSDDGGAR